MSDTTDDPELGDDALYQREADEVYAELLSRIGEAHAQPRLGATRRVVELLGDPQRAYPIIHITGTNGKTSTSRIIESILRAHDLRTGLLTSPHLVRVNERIVIDGQPISNRSLAQTSLPARSVTASASSLAEASACATDQSISVGAMSSGWSNRRAAKIAAAATRPAPTNPTATARSLSVSSTIAAATNPAMIAANSGRSGLGAGDAGSVAMGLPMFGRRRAVKRFG